MTEIDYGKMSRHQKLAVFLIIVGPEAAAEILRHFDDAEIEVLCREMSTVTIIPSEVQRVAIEEFSGLVAQSAGSALGGLGYAQRTLEIAKGDYKASAIVGRIGPVVGTSVEVIKDISEMEGRQIFNLVKHEQPQTISFLLSYLDSAKSAEVFGLLGPELREEVIERLGTIESTSLELVSKIARSLGKHYDSKARPAFHRSGGVRAVADLLNQLDKEMGKNLLGRLERTECRAQCGDPQETFQLRGSQPPATGRSAARVARSRLLQSGGGDEVRERTAARSHLRGHFQAGRRRPQGRAPDARAGPPQGRRSRPGLHHPGRFAASRRRARSRSNPKARRASSTRRPLLLHHPFLPTVPPSGMAFAKLIPFDRTLQGVAVSGQGGRSCSEAEVARREEAAYQRGVDAARALADQQMVEFRADIAELSEGLFDKVSNLEPALVAQVRDALPALALDLARRLLAGFEPSPELLSRLCEEALTSIYPERDNLELVVAERDAVLLEKLNPDWLKRYPGLRIRGEASLVPGDCLVRSRFGLSDARLQTKLTALQHSLFST